MVTTRLGAQHVVFTPAIPVPTTDSVNLVVRRTSAELAVDSTHKVRIYVGRLIATRRDTLLVETSRDTVAVGASDVLALRVRHYSAARERLETGSEAATYGAVIGAAAGWLTGIVARSLHGDAPKHSVIIGTALGATLGFVGGATSGDLSAAYRLEEVRVSVAN